MLWKYVEIPKLIQVNDDFFPTEKMLFDLDDLIPSHENWKIQFDLRNSMGIPKVLSQAVEIAQDVIRTKFTTAILEDDFPGKDPAAYQRHASPSRFEYWSLLLCTLRWEADFSIWDVEWVQHDFWAIPNRMMYIINPSSEYRVSSPKNFGYRSWLLLGVET